MFRREILFDKDIAKNESDSLYVIIQEILMVGVLNTYGQIRSESIPIHFPDFYAFLEMKNIEDEVGKKCLGLFNSILYPMIPEYDELNPNPRRIDRTSGDNTIDKYSKTNVCGDSNEKENENVPMKVHTKFSDLGYRNSVSEHSSHENDASTESVKAIYKQKFNTRIMKKYTEKKLFIRVERNIGYFY